MPIYEYQCSTCGHQFEIIQKVNDELLTQCPDCNNNTLRKLMSSVGFRLKGAGWYETDFKSGSKKNIAQGDKSKESVEKPKKPSEKSKESKNSTSDKKDSKKTSTTSKKTKS